VKASGYEDRAARVEVVQSMNPIWFIAAFIMTIVIAGAFFYWRQMPPFELEKQVTGQDVTLRIRNRSADHIPRLLIMDTLPAMALASAQISPSIESIGNEDHLTWEAEMEPGEEIAISYQANATSEGFVIRVGDHEYRSGYGIIPFARHILRKIPFLPDIIDR